MSALTAPASPQPGEADVDRESAPNRYMHALRGRWCNPRSCTKWLNGHNALITVSNDLHRRGKFLPHGKLSRPDIGISFRDAKQLAGLNALLTVGVP